MTRDRVARIAFLAGCLSLAAGSVFGQQIVTRKAFNEYQQFIWNDQQGLPQNSVNAITRTRDGYLWLATFEGVVRFDGVRFSVFDTSNTEAITIGLTRAIVEDRGGALWIGFDGGGLVRYEHGRFKQYTTRDGLIDDHVHALLEDRTGNLWIGTDGGGLARFSNGTFRSFTTTDGLPDNHVWALAESGDGTIWIGTTQGLAGFKDGRFTVYGTSDGLADPVVRSLDVDAHDAVWIGTAGGLNRLSLGRITRVTTKGGLLDQAVRVVYHDRNGTLWVGTDDGGVYRRKGERFERYTTTDGLPVAAVASIYQDSDGDVWIGTDGGGMAQLRRPRFQTISSQDGLGGRFVTALHGDDHGAIWAATEVGMTVIRPGSIEVHQRRAAGLPATSIRSMSIDGDGTAWLGTRDGFWRWADGRATQWTVRDGLPMNNVYPVLADHAGAVWIGTLGGGLVRFRDNRFIVYTTRDGLAHNDVFTLFEDRAGSLWIGTRSGGMSRLKDGRFTTWSTDDGLGSNFVYSFFEDGSGTLWIGTHGGGLSRLKDGILTRVTTRDGLYDDVAFQILEDDSRNLWISSNRGIYRASLEELNAFLDGRTRSVSSFAYGVADGMLSRECVGGLPGGWKTPDGRLWFGTVDGVVAVDSSHRNTTPPLVALETIAIDREPVPLGQPIRISPKQQNLEITYTALSWSRPDQVRFKYQIPGVDQTWVDAGSRRMAYYSRLRPGTYTFTVIADNGEGVWNLEGKSVDIVVLPAFYQTAWFIAAASLTVFGGVGLGWRYRVRQLRLDQAAQQAFSAQLIASQEGERKRIAAELHDGLGQSLLVIKNQAVLQAMRHPSTETGSAFHEFGGQVSQAIDEVRAISWNLRPSHLDQLGLRTALIVMTEKMATAGGIAIDHAIDPCDHVLPLDDEIMVYRIVQECLNNVVKHAQATCVELMIRRTETSITITVRDDGRGFAPKPTSDVGKGGLGLPGIAERVRMLKGAHTIASAPGQGTTVTTTIPVDTTNRVSSRG